MVFNLPQMRMPKIKITANLQSSPPKEPKRITLPSISIRAQSLENGYDVGEGYGGEGGYGGANSLSEYGDGNSYEEGNSLGEYGQGVEYGQAGGYDQAGGYGQNNYNSNNAAFNFKYGSSRFSLSKSAHFPLRSFGYSAPHYAGNSKSEVYVKPEGESSLDSKYRSSTQFASNSHLFNNQPNFSLNL